MCGGSAPAAPNPTLSAQDQIGINQQSIADTAQYNEVDQNSPYGSSTWSGTAGSSTDPLTQTTTLNPQQQQLLNTETGTSNTLANEAAASTANVSTAPLNVGETDQAQQFSPSEVTPMQTGYGSGGQIQGGVNETGQQIFAQPAQGNIQTSLGYTGQPVQGQIYGGGGTNQQVQAAEQAAYGQQTGLLAPQFSQQQNQVNSQLAAQGIVPGSAAYNQAQTQLSNNQNSIYQQAADSAVTSGQNEQNTLYGQNLQSGEFANSAAAQEFSQGLQSGEFGNAAQAESFGENSQAQQNTNAALENLYGQNLSSGQFANAAQAQGNSQNAQAAQFANTANQNQLAEILGLNQENQSQYTSAQQNAVGAQDQPINVQAALLGATPVSPSNPSFQSTPSYTPSQAAPNAIGLAGSEYGSQEQAAASTLGSIFGGIGSLGSSYISSPYNLFG